MKHLIISLVLITPNILFSQWIVSNSGTTTILRSVYTINNSTAYVSGDNGLIIKTTNNGQSWNSLNTGITDNINSVYFLNTSSGVACANAGKIIVTTNSGGNWSTVTSPVTDDLRAISFFNNKGVCSGSSGTILYTSNAGLNWAVAQNGFFNVFYGAAMTNENLAFVCGVNSIFQPFVGKSVNGGANWSFSNFYLNGNEGGLDDIQFISEQEGFACAYVFDGQGAISYTSNGGANWSTQLFPYQLYSIDFIESNIGYSTGENGLILKTTNKGILWISQQSPASFILRSIDFSDSLNGFTVGNDGIILKTTNGGLSSVNNGQENNPGNFFLSQNYPNPFNPQTIINYTVGASELRITNYTLLKVSDITGRDLITLVNEKQNAGAYSVTFDGTNFPGGIYFYTLKNGRYSETKKFILLK